MVRFGAASADAASLLPIAKDNDGARLLRTSLAQLQPGLYWHGETCRAGGPRWMPPVMACRTVS